MDGLTKLTPEAVETTAARMLYEEHPDPIPDDAVLVDAIVGQYGFDPTRIERQKPSVAALLLELDDSFQKTGGGGTSFLNACNDRHGRQWTGLHAQMALLFAAGEACGLVKCLMPRELWEVLPGGMPYYQVDDEACREELGASSAAETHTSSEPASPLPRSR